MSRAYSGRQRAILAMKTMSIESGGSDVRPQTSDLGSHLIQAPPTLADLQLSIP